jgi:FAD/FMN-containing dehydrogenase
MEKTLSRSGLVSGLRSELGRRLLLPGTPDYENARRVWNGMHDRRPALIGRCLTASDVSIVLRHANAAGLPVTIRGGGHNVAGLAVADGAVMIDLSLMRGVVVDPAERRAWVQGGCLLRDVDVATAAYGLACPAGVVSHTGLGGLALGGGYGWLARKWGLTCDHILAAEVVLADGSMVEATGTQHADLLWALRGGGGNFGVVTRFTLGLRPAGSVHYHTRIYTLDDLGAALAAYRGFAVKQPGDLHVVGALKYAGQQDWIPACLSGEPGLFLTAAWFGDPDLGTAAASPLFESAPPPSAAHTRLMTYLELQALGDHGEPHGNRYFTKSCYLADLPAQAAAEFRWAVENMPDRRSSVDFEYLRGAIADVPDGDSAFPGRLAPYIYTASAQWSDHDRDTENIAWTRCSVDRVSGFQYDGGYMNYLQDGGAGKIMKVYGIRRYRLLAGIKQRYDPDNIFRHNQNILPVPPEPENEGRGRARVD